MASIAEMLVNSGLQSSQQAPDFAGSIQKGAELAQTVENIQYQRQQMEHAKQELEFKKDERAIAAIERGAALKSPKMKNLYFKNALPNILKHMGREDMFSPQVMEMFNADIEVGLQKVQGLIRDVRGGHKTRAEAYATLKDPELFALAQEYDKEFAAAEEAATDFIERKTVAAITAGRKEDYGDVKDFESMALDLGQRVRTEFKPIEDKKAAIRQAHNGLNKVLTELRNGKKSNSIEFNTAARSLAKAFNSGAMTDADVADFRNLTGIDNITEDAINKWFTGGVNVDAVNSLIGIAKRSAQTIDQQAATLSKGFAPQFESSRFPTRSTELRKRSGIDAFMQPTLRPDDRKSGPLIRGKTLEQWAVLINNNPDKAAAALEQLSKETGKTTDVLKKEMGIK